MNGQPSSILLTLPMVLSNSSDSGSNLQISTASCIATVLPLLNLIGSGPKLAILMGTVLCSAH